jgi:ketosteroid isomerase-like protein
MANSNTALIERIFGKVGGGFAPIDAPLYLQSMTEEVSYTVPGTTKLSGVFRGRDQIVAGIFKPFMASLDGGIRVPLRYALRRGATWSPCRAHGRARAKNGGRYDNTYCFVFRFRDGRIAEITEYLDTDLVRTALGI